MDICLAEANQDTTVRLKKKSTLFFTSSSLHGRTIFPPSICRTNPSNSRININQTSRISKYQHRRSPLSRDTSYSEGFSSWKVNPSICLVEASLATTTHLKQTSSLYFTSYHLYSSSERTTSPLHWNGDMQVKWIENVVKSSIGTTNSLNPFMMNINDHYAVNESFSFTEVSSTSICPVEASSDTAVALENPILAENNRHAPPPKNDRNAPVFALPILSFRSSSILHQRSSTLLPIVETANPNWSDEYRLFPFISTSHSNQLQVSENNNTADNFDKCFAYRSVTPCVCQLQTCVQRLGTYSRFLQGGTPTTLG